MQQWDVIIIGGGAAGLMCAAAAGGRGRRVLVLDHANKMGKKILMSGGGRCNFTNLYTEPSHFICNNPHFCKSALSRYTQWDFLELVQRHGVAYHEKAPGQLFCDNKASDILNLLLAECEAASVTLQTRCSVDEIIRDTQYRLQTSCGEHRAESLVVATGGLSIPTMGATGFGFDIARQFGLPVLPTDPSLVPFTLSGALQACAAELAGVALPANVATPTQAFAESLLFTHRGLSGPAVLQASNYWHLGETIRLDLLPGCALEEQLLQWQRDSPRQQLKTLLATLLPKRFITTWLADRLPDKTLANCSKVELRELAASLQAFEFTPAGTEGYRTAEVTRGGVDTDAVSSKTFEAKAVPGLYFVGEVLDVTGWLGGFNFQWAWASGHCAGQYA